MNIPIVIYISLIVFLSETLNCYSQDESIMSLGLNACLPPKNSSKCRKTLDDADYQVFNIAFNMEYSGENDFVALKKALATKFKTEYLFSQGTSKDDLEGIMMMIKLVSCMPPKNPDNCIKSLRDDAYQVYNAVYNLEKNQDDDISPLMKALVAYFKNEYLR
ncbi:uncharacterized protein LOC141854462 [Brevipalpus obovatus]|uniref:uncharacterized protein LOC141854462 n=1 Tax=Brevipalpus obovatus TaxID=246614 RepID=UPI003D9F9B6D